MTMKVALTSALMAFNPLQANTVLDILNVTPSEQSVDYVTTKNQFHLHSLMTEQRHPKTWDLSSTIKANTLAGVEALLSVDEDITTKFKTLSLAELEQAAQSIERAIMENKKIYIYGCGATGRLAKQMESTFWRPFWNKHPKLKDLFPNIENALVGEMTGADRALISSLEGFEDLQLIGKLQLEEHGIQKGDVVIAVTEGGETSSVIGTILTAAKQYNDITDAPKNLYFIYNNPDEVLQPFERSQSVINNKAITKIRLFTGPQAITGSTRMQATTSETFIVGMMLEQAIHNVLKNYLSKTELAELGFDPNATMRSRLSCFEDIQKAVRSAKDQIAQFTDLEAKTYTNQRFATYFAQEGMITVFIDSTERSPTFRLFPLDTVNEPQRKCWLQVWTPAKDQADAWQKFLGRPFHGLSPNHYEMPFSTEIADSYLRKSALNSLKNAGDEQQALYDFSFNASKKAPKEGDLGVMVMMHGETITDGSKWLDLFQKSKANVAVIAISTEPVEIPNALVVQLPIPCQYDPLAVRQNIGLKMMLNAHSTATMAKLGRVIGNTMTNVSPSNLKLIGRATFLIQSHVNDHLPKEKAVSYKEVNAVLFDAIEYCKQIQRPGQTPEVALTIIRMHKALKENRNVSWEEAEQIMQTVGLEGYLVQNNI